MFEKLELTAVQQAAILPTIQEWGYKNITRQPPSDGLPHIALHDNGNMIVSIVTPDLQRPDLFTVHIVGNDQTVIHSNLTIFNSALERNRIT